MVDINQLISQAKAMQEKVKIAQSELAKQEITAESGNGLVKITMTCTKDIKGCVIDESLLSKDKKEDLEDLIVAAVQKAKDKAEDVATSALEEATAGLDIPSGMDLPV